MAAIAEQGDFRIAGPDRIGFVSAQSLGHVTQRRLLPRFVLAALQHEPQELARGVRKRYVLEDERRQHRVEFGRVTDRTDRHMRMLRIGRNGLQRGIPGILRDVINRDRVVGQADFSGEVGLVVARVQPRKRAGHEPAGVLRAFSAWQSFRKPARSRGIAE